MNTLNIGKKAAAAAAITLAGIGVAYADAASCRTAIGSCLLAVIEADLACAAAAETAGFLTPVCATGIANGAFTCSTSVPRECPLSSNRTVYSAGAYGATAASTDTVQDLKCSGPDRVRKANFWTKSVGGVQRITAVEITCNNSKGSDTVHTFINNKTNATWDGSTCGNNPHNLIQGFAIRANSTGVNAMGVKCDQTFNTGVTDWSGVIVGGTSGTLSNSLCTERDYVVGLKVWRNSSNFVKRLEVFCAKTTS